MVHANAPLSERGRLRLARLIVEGDVPIAAAAARFQVHPVGRVRRLLAAGGQGQILGGDLAGPGEQVHARSGVVGGEGGGQLLTGPAERVGEGLRDPALHLGHAQRHGARRAVRAQHRHAQPPADRAMRRPRAAADHSGKAMHRAQPRIGQR